MGPTCRALTTPFALVPNRRDDSDSVASQASGEQQTMTKVLAHPPSESCTYTKHARQRVLEHEYIGGVNLAGMLAVSGRK